MRLDPLVPSDAPGGSGTAGNGTDPNGRIDARKGGEGRDARDARSVDTGDPGSGDTDDARAAGSALDDRAAGILALSALVLLGCALVYAFVLPLTPVRLAVAGAGLIEPSAVWSRLAALPWPVPADPPTLASSILVVGAISVVGYGVAIAATWRRRATRRGLALVLLPAAAFLLVSALALPTQSSDIVDYLLSGRVAAVHGADPYEVAPAAFPDDPLLAYASGTYSEDPEQKPPVWIAGAVGAAALTAGAAPADAVLLTRLLFLALTVANVALIGAVLRRWRPQHLLSGLVIYAWSPVVVLHGQAKFDTLMATFALLSALLLVHRRPLPALAAMWLSVLVKLLTLPLVVMSAIGELAAGRWRRVLAGLVIVVVLTVGLYLMVAGDPLGVVADIGAPEEGGRTLPAFVTVPLAMVTVIAVIWSGVRSRGEIEPTLQGWALVSLTTIPLTPIGWSWYLIAPIALVSLSGERWRTAALVGLTGVGFLADTWLRSTSPTFPLPAPFGLGRAEALVLGVAVLLVVLAVVVGLTRRPAILSRPRRGPEATADTD